ncbi:MAG: hypothetical protein DRI54_03400 [Bacteroidetes bacterium]|nr:MAG: hypothetical protein DRI54_03400 [Bacteroidota bacterium]
MSNALKKENTKQQKSGFAPARFLVSVLNGEALQGEGMFRNISFMVYLVVMLIIYLGYGYYSERSLRELMEADAKLKDKKAEYVTNKSMLEQKKLQSKIAASVRKDGLIESRVSPYKIVTDNSHFEKKD